VDRIPRAEHRRKWVSGAVQYGAIKRHKLQRSQGRLQQPVEFRQFRIAEGALQPEPIENPAPKRTSP
jgi:hypothetical protein